MPVFFIPNNKILEPGPLNIKQIFYWVFDFWEFGRGIFLFLAWWVVAVDPSCEAISFTLVLKYDNCFDFIASIFVSHCSVYVYCPVSKQHAPHFRKRVVVFNVLAIFKLNMIWSIIIHQQCILKLTNFSFELIKSIVCI